MILKFKTEYNSAMPLMDTFLANGYHPVMSVNDDEMIYHYTIAIDTDDVINEKKDCCDLKLDYLKNPCTPDCPDFERCWDRVDESTKEENNEAVEEFLNLLMRDLSKSATKKSRILNE